MHSLADTPKKSRLACAIEGITSVHSGRKSGTTTFARASTATFVDFEGIVRTVSNGEPAFLGARQVRNLVTYSEDFSHSSWALTGGALKLSTTELGPDGRNNACLLQDGTATYPGLQKNITGYPITRQYRVSVSLKAGTASTAFLAIQETGAPYGVTGVQLNLTNNWARYSILTNRISSVLADSYLLIRAGTSTGANEGTIYCAEPQVELVDGQSNTNPGEYVLTTTQAASVFFPYLNGNTVASNIVTPGVGALISKKVLRGVIDEVGNTNGMYYSEDLSNAAWLKTGILSTVASATIAAPDGNIGTAWKLTEDTSTGYHMVAQAGIVWADSAYLHISIYAKAAERSKINIQMRDKQATPTYPNATFDLSAGTYTVAAGAQAVMTPLANGWYRCSMSGPLNTGTAASPFWIFLSNGSNTSYTGNGVSGIYLWGGQLYQGNFPTSYIKTTSAPVARAATQRQVQATGNIRSQDWWAMMAVTLCFNGADNKGGYPGLFSSTVDSNNRTDVFVNQPIAQLGLERYVGAVPDSAIVASSWSAGDLIIVAVRNSRLAGGTLWVKNVTTGSSIVTTTNAVAKSNLLGSNILFGSPNGGNANTCQAIKNFRLYYEDAPDSKITEAINQLAAENA